MGLPVISTPIEELKRFPKFVKIGKNPGEWSKYTNDLLSKIWSKKHKEEQRRLAEQNSWEIKVNMILNSISAT